MDGLCTATLGIAEILKVFRILAHRNLKLEEIALFLLSPIIYDQISSRQLRIYKRCFKDIYIYPIGALQWSYLFLKLPEQYAYGASSVHVSSRYWADKLGMH